MAHPEHLPALTPDNHAGTRTGTGSQVAGVDLRNDDAAAALAHVSCTAAELLLRLRDNEHVDDVEGLFGRARDELDLGQRLWADHDSNVAAVAHGGGQVS